MRHLLMAGSALAALGAAGAASAQVLPPPSGVYVAGDIGYHFPETFEGESNVNASDGRPYQWNFGGSDDLAGFGRLGYKVSPNWRVELEYGYRRSELDSILGSSNRAQPIGLCRAGVRRTAAAPTCQSPDEASMRASSVMFNVIYDLFDDSARIRPFVGLGVGAVEVHTKAFGQLSGVPAGGAPFQNASFDDMDQGLGYQGILGVSYAVTDRISVDLTGRYLAANGLEFGSVTTNAGATPGGAVTNVGIFEGDYRDASVSLGLRYQFGAPVAPPPPPVTQPPVAATPTSQEFVVYFPFDQSVLTPEAQGVIQQAAAYAQQGAPTSVVIVGHADTSGSAAYNVRLSERRSRAVADALVGMGIQQTALQVDWRGETQPAVPTPDGVKEPLNRRTTIGINF